MPSLEVLANEPILRKPKDNVYTDSVHAGLIRNSLTQQTGTVGYQSYMLNEEPRMEEIMVIGRPFYDDSKGVKINPLLKSFPSVTSASSTAFLPNTIALPSNAQQQSINTLTGLLRSTQTVTTLPNTTVN